MIEIAVTELEYRKAKSVFDSAGAKGFHCVSAPASEVELAAFVREHNIAHAIVGVETYTGALYDALAEGGVLARFGVGHDTIDKRRATKAGLFCTNTPGALDDSVAEYTLALMLAAARGLPGLVRDTQAGGWEPIVGAELRGKTLAVIGCGPIGCRVAEIAAFGFKMHVIGCEIRTVDAEIMRKQHGFAEIVADFADAVRNADFVSLHIPSSRATEHFINRDRPAQLRANAWLINTARGAIVDEQALYDALTERTLAGAALDVFENEPYRPVDPEKDLRTLPNVIATPHVASSTQEACNRMAEQALANIVLAGNGQHQRMNLLNPEVLQAR